MKYYSTQRPLMPGCCPRAGVQEVVNFDDKKFCKEIGCEAWGFVEYNRELTQDEVDDYELTPAGIHTGASPQHLMTTERLFPALRM